MVRRFSLPDVYNPELSKIGVFRFPRVSCAAASAEDANLDPAVAGQVFEFFCFCFPPSSCLVSSCRLMNFLGDVMGQTLRPGF